MSLSTQSEITSSIPGLWCQVICRGEWALEKSIEVKAYPQNDPALKRSSKLSRVELQQEFGRVTFSLSMSAAGQWTCPLRRTSKGHDTIYFLAIKHKHWSLRNLYIWLASRLFLLLIILIKYLRPKNEAAIT